MADNIVVHTEQLTRHFGSNVAVDHLSINISKGEVFGFLGHNGAGKTTTVRLLNGVLAPTTGAAQVFGLDPAVDGHKIRARTGVLTETPALDDRLTARVTLELFAEIYGVPETQVRARAGALLEQFELAERANAKIGSFSKGMRQRMALARTLIHDPELVFLDEPTSGLDPVATREVHQLIRTLSDQGRTVFLCTHNLIEAERLCDRVAVLAHGRLLAMGTTQELAAMLTSGHRLLLEVRADQAAAATALLCDMPHVLEVVPQTDRVADRHQAVLLSVHGVARDAVPSALAQLAQAGIDIFRVEPDEASLEDVYFALQVNL